MALSTIAQRTAVDSLLNIISADSDRKDVSRNGFLLSRQGSSPFYTPPPSPDREYFIPLGSTGKGPYHEELRKVTRDLA